VRIRPTASNSSEPNSPLIADSPAVQKRQFSNSKRRARAWQKTHHLLQRPAMLIVLCAVVSIALPPVGLSLTASATSPRPAPVSLWQRFRSCASDSTTTAHTDTT